MHKTVLLWSHTDQKWLGLQSETITIVESSILTECQTNVYLLVFTYTLLSSLGWKEGDIFDMVTLKIFFFQYLR